VKKTLAFLLALTFVVTFSTGVFGADQGKAVYDSKCLICHGPKGEGNGPGAALVKTKPASFNDPKFWQGNVEEKITHAITAGKGEMVKVDLKPAEIKAAIAYITQMCKPK
jgi:mono/diheme cytochrome c family protein